jgi:aspartate/glutamate racemase
LKKRVACLHAHYSNIEYIESAFSPYEIELIHFVDPALIYRVSSDIHFKESDAQKKVIEQIEWIAQCNVDVILITCTNYIALLQEEQLSISIPIIKIDEPYFNYIINLNGPQVILFTNPATVEGTINRLRDYAKMNNKELDIEVIVIDHIFDLLMKGLKEEYNLEISKYIEKIIHDSKVLSVAQLSMVKATEQFGQKIVNPLDPLVDSMVQPMQLIKKTLPCN